MDMHRARAIAAAPRVGNQKGQAIVEAGIVVLMLVLLLLGVIEFGRGFMVANMVTNAARVGARMASLMPTSERDANGTLLDTTPIETAVRDFIANADPAAQFASSLAVDVVQTDGTVPTVEVRVSGDVPFIFGFPSLNSGSGTPSTFTVDRSVTFPDQNHP